MPDPEHKVGRVDVPSLMEEFKKQLEQLGRIPNQSVQDLPIDKAVETVHPEAWFNSQTDKDVRSMLSEMGAPCCPDGCIGRVQHLTAVLEVRNVVRHVKNPNHCYVCFDLERLESVQKPDKTHLPTMFLCCVCHKTWEVDKALKIDWFGKNTG